MEIKRDKNVATYIGFPLKDAGNRPELFTGTAWGALTGASIVCYTWADGGAPAVHTLAGTPTEIGTTGEWYLALSQAEMNPDSGADDYMLIKLDADEIDPQTVLVNLKAMATAAELAKVPKSDAAVTWNATALASINAEVDTALTSLNDIAASDILGTALTESYGAKNATRTLTQLLYEIKSMLTNHAISGTTWTTKKLDGTTTAKTYTLNDDDAPSSCVEAS